MIKLLVFGTGSVADIICEHYLDMSKTCILAFINTITQENDYRGHKVISLDCASGYDYDYVLIAAESFDIIHEKLLNVGIHKTKIIGIPTLSGRFGGAAKEIINQECENVFNSALAKLIFKKALPACDVFSYNASNTLHLRGRDFDSSSISAIDSVRLHTLIALSREIEVNKVFGNVAELGVYRGDFACNINKFFPERNLYLFDTFTGFSESDISYDKHNNYSNSSSQAFTETSVELVLSKMPFREKCLVYEGYFPESAKNIDDTFSFVSIDADLYKPIYAGLNFFYERLSKGGYIMIHDFNLLFYSGAREAVTQFCSEQGIGYCPIPDSCGSVVICK